MYGGLYRAHNRLHVGDCRSFHGNMIDPAVNS